jgi:hypothetical protein
MLRMLAVFVCGSLLSGATALAEQAVAADGLAAGPAWTADGDQADAQFAFSVAAAGDVNGDGFGDVIASAPFYDNGQLNEGRVFAYYGSATGPSTGPSWVFEGDQVQANIGYSIASAGDVNGDGYDDVIVGARLYDNGQGDEGGLWVYYGAAAGLATSPSWSAESNQAAAFLGGSVATAGDVNGDGYDDVIGGAVAYDNGQADEGRAYVYYGSASGLASTPSWTAESNQAGAQFGAAVSSAGDVNGDGYDDVIVGSSFYANGQTQEGRAFVYYGSASGLASTPSWTAESNQTGARMGFSLGRGSDVNGDGYSDVIVGVYLYDNVQADKGQVLVYYGSATGLPASPSWTAEGTQTSELFGFALNGAGDVNADGYADLIVGAVNHDNGQTDEGQALVYYGSAAGLAASPSWTAEIDQTGASFGAAVAAAGDVNGDGGADVIVGARSFDNVELNKGRAFIYYGQAPPPAAGGVESLVVGRADGEQIVLGWGASCKATDTDYAIYEGILGSFASHVSRVCSTGGATTETLTPEEGDTYYLVVPRNGTYEGSYGKTSAGTERAAAAVACMPQQVGACP